MRRGHLLNLSLSVPICKVGHNSTYFKGFSGVIVIITETERARN